MEVITVIFLFSITAANCVFILPADDETYKILLKLCNNNFAVSITKQTNVEKAAVVCVSVCVCGGGRGGGRGGRGMGGVNWQTIYNNS